jgi:putative transposase
VPRHPRRPPRDPVRAIETLRQGVRACFGAFAKGIASSLKLRHDHVSQFVADDFHRKLAFLGIMPSPIFVREPEGKGPSDSSAP